MARLLFLFSLLSVLLFSLSFADEDSLIRQVVDGSTSSLPSADDLVLNADLHFASFIRRFGKSYSGPEEHAHRLSVFRRNMRRARRHQRLDPTAVHGVTQFSDLTPEEFRRTYLGLRKGRKSMAGSAHQAPILPTNDLPEDFDWRDKGAVTGVKNQGSCGSCWSFSTSGALEGANFLATGKLESLSEQQMVDCDHECDSEEPDDCDQGCNGGLMNTAFQYLQKVGGLESEKDYPYTGADRGTCKFDKSKIKASVHNFSVVSIDEEQIAANLVKHGPLAIAITRSSCRRTLVVSHAHTYVGSIWIMVCF
ncbi:cysteine proteinase 1 precursor [Iris pallida]|uniref:Cysteine proteinase 1 n=1 Tax=Iris pallida TaxID=29817 RepID=A0AAX6FCL5_IRIPA|nr:cysteine proteinase 1 precursor [Iris pallida]